MNESRIATPVPASQSGRARRSQAAVVARYVQELSGRTRPVLAARRGCGPAPARIGRVAA
jgi:hypothetical protein